MLKLEGGVDDSSLPTTPEFSCKIQARQRISRLTRYSSISAPELVRICAESNDGAAWEEFVCRFHRQITLSILRITRSWSATPRQQIDDLVQETYLKLCADHCRLLLGFSIERPEAISGYVKTIAVNVARDHLKANRSQKRGAGQVHKSLSDPVSDSDAQSPVGSESMERQVLLRQISDYLDSCSSGPDQDRDRLIFWLYYRQGMSAKAIAALPTVNLTDKGVGSVILRLTRLVRQRVLEAPHEPPDRRESDGQGFRPAESY